MNADIRTEMYQSRAQSRSYSSSYRYMDTEPRDWRRQNSNHIQRKAKQDIEVQDTAKKRAIWGIVVLFVVLGLCAVLLIFLFREDPVVTRICVPGFQGTLCEKSDFIGTYRWNTDKFYELEDGLKHNRGIAYRVYAPHASSVSIVCTTSSGFDEAYAMHKQSNGYWFCNVGSIGYGNEFFVKITGANGLTFKRLVQGGKEIVYAADGWRNREANDNDTKLTLTETNNLREFASNAVIYTLQISTFSSSSYGTFESTIQFLDYLWFLGVTIIRLMALEASTCNGDTSANIFCWYNTTVLFAGVPHPSYGAQGQLRALINAIHARGMSVITDMDWSGFASESNYYDYDGSSYPSPAGPLFQNGSSYQYHNRVLYHLDMDVDRPARSLLHMTLYRYSNVFGFDGVYWRGLLCLRLDGVHCEVGKGRDNFANTQFLRSVVEDASVKNSMLWFGEDTTSAMNMSDYNGDIVDIVRPVSEKGIGFHGKRDDTPCQQLIEIYFSREIDMIQLLRFVESISSLQANLINLETAESASIQRLNTRILSYHSDLVIGLHQYTQLLFFYFATPGIINLFMGFEYNEKEVFDVLPKPLGIDKKVGVFQNGVWRRIGEYNYAYNITQRLLSLRQERIYYYPYDTHIIYSDEKSQTFSYTTGNDKNQRVVFINASDRESGKVPAVIGLPAPYGEKTTWQYDFNTDDSELYSGFINHKTAIRVYKCNDSAIYSYCGSVYYGAYAVKVLYPVMYN